MPRIRQILLWLVIAFFVYAIMKSPAKAGDIVSTAWQIVIDGVTALGKFFDALLNH